MRPIHPNIGDKWTDDNGVELEYVDHNRWVKVGTAGHARIKRVQEYPSVGEQLDMLFHELSSKGSIDTNGEWYQLISGIKNNIPVPFESEEE